MWAASSCLSSSAQSLDIGGARSQNSRKSSIPMSISATPQKARRSRAARDRWRCQNPRCTSRHVTPHHIVFRSAGGGEDRSILLSLCSICHLELVHGCDQNWGAASLRPPELRAEEFAGAFASRKTNLG